MAMGKTVNYNAEGEEVKRFMAKVVVQNFISQLPPSSLSYYLGNRFPSADFVSSFMNGLHNDNGTRSAFGKIVKKPKSKSEASNLFNPKQRINYRICEMTMRVLLPRTINELEKNVLVRHRGDTFLGHWNFLYRRCILVSIG